MGTASVTTDTPTVVGTCASLSGCNGRGSCVNEQCYCDEDYTGDDCSIEAFLGSESDSHPQLVLPTVIMGHTVSNGVVAAPYDKSAVITVPYELVESCTWVRVAPRRRDRTRTSQRPSLTSSLRSIMYCSYTLRLLTARCWMLRNCNSKRSGAGAAHLTATVLAVETAYATTDIASATMDSSVLNVMSRIQPKALTLPLVHRVIPPPVPVLSQTLHSRHTGRWRLQTNRLRRRWPTRCGLRLLKRSVHSWIQSRQPRLCKRTR